MNWSTRLRRWVRIRTPPVREASTKPSAATVLPAPVACSNQKRRAASGSSGCSSSWMSSSSRRRRAASPAAPRRRRPRLARSSSSGRSIVLVRPRRLASDELVVRLVERRPRARRRSRLRSRSSSSTTARFDGDRAVADLHIGEQRGQRVREGVDLVGGEHGAVDELGLVLRQQPLEPEQQRELAAPLE